MKINWSRLTPTEFEKLCSLILHEMEFTDIQWFGKSGGDKGRDLTANKEESPLPSSKRMARWIVQCKRYTTKPPTKRDVQSFLEDAEEHSPDNVLLIVTNTLTPATKDWIEKISRTRKYPFDIHFWEELDLEREITHYRSEISERLPKILGQADPVTVEEVDKKQQYFFSCREVQEIEIVAIDKPSEEKAKADVIEFVRFLRENDVTFSWEKRRHRRPKRSS